MKLEANVSEIILPKNSSVVKAIYACAPGTEVLDGSLVLFYLNNSWVGDFICGG